MAKFRSTDIELLASADVDEIVCAGAPAEKWKANADPDADWAGITRLMEALDASRASSCVLVSTVDVYAAPGVLTNPSRPTPTRSRPTGGTGPVSRSSSEGGSPTCSSFGSRACSGLG
ncbi:hypothetical protein [Blastococcus brunescens]|uniref:Uncharacterized protein n=1 Tax=Blastococcus brunescens TaxID=1564165 RepID=A0ABZ1AZN8_9ACTN|nr:hypothetical protein [Blastococcus sp. BMG 8361]WRL62918.1 hypothetical protein U6N30_24095 [Blastococcus sp. BMG 8361]